MCCLWWQVHMTFCLNSHLIIHLSKWKAMYQVKWIWLIPNLFTLSSGDKRFLMSYLDFKYMPNKCWPLFSGVFFLLYNNIDYMFHSTFAATRDTIDFLKMLFTMKCATIIMKDTISADLIGSAKGTPSKYKITPTCNNQFSFVITSNVFNPIQVQKI